MTTTLNSDSLSLHLNSATILAFDGVPETIGPDAITPLAVTKTLNNTLYQPVNLTTKGPFGSPFTIGAAGAITVAGYNAITSFLTSAATVITDGTILATDVGSTHGNGIVLLTDGGVVTNQAQGKITAGYLGIYTKDFATVTNAGIDTGGGFGVFMNSGGDVTNSGLISAPSVANPTGSPQHPTGIDLHGAGTITNLAGGTVSGFDATGIKYGVGEIVNNGLLEGALLGAYLGAGGVVVNNGIITANLSAGNNAVVLYRGGSLNNAGFVYGEGALGYGVVFGNGAGAITNSGTIRGGNEAIQAYASGQISNTGLITGAKAGIAFEASTLDSLAVIKNNGAITGGTDGIQIFASGQISNGTLSLIEGGADGILFENAGVAETATVLNSGIIESARGTAGIAIDFGTAVARLTLAAAGTLIGQVIADGAAGNLLDLTGTRTTVLAGIGSEITGFTTIQFAAHSTAAIEGNVAGLAAGEKIEGFKSTDTIILDGFAVSSASYVNKKGFDLFDGSTEVKLDTTGKLKGNFLLQTENGDTTLSAIGASAILGTGAVEILLDGGKQSGAQVDQGGLLEVYKGGVAKAAIVNAGGLLKVFNGGTATGSLIQAGGREIVGAGAIAGTATLAGGTLEITKGATLQNGLRATNAGGTLQLDGGAIVPGTFAAGIAGTDVLLLTGKSKTPLAGLGTAINGFHHITFATGAAWGLAGNITGIANGETFAGFAAGDTLTMRGFGGLNGTYAGGDLDLFNNGAKEVVTLGLAGGVDLLVQGANAVSTITGLAGTAALSVGADAFEIVTAGAIAENAVITSGGVQIVVAGGTASSTSLQHGSLTVSSGGTASDVKTGKGGVLTVLSGGVADGGTVSAGGTEILNGSASGTTIAGSATLAAGGTLAGGTIAGGMLDSLTGGTLAGTLAFSGTNGELRLSSASPTAVITGFLITDTIDVTGFSATSSSFVTGQGLELSSGGQTITLDLAGDFSSGLFKIKATSAGTLITLSANPPATPATAAIPLTNPRMTMLAPSASTVAVAKLPDLTRADAAAEFYFRADHAIAVIASASPSGWIAASLLPHEMTTPPVITLQP